MWLLLRDHKIALVTGASSGIGAELAKVFAKRGGKHLVAVARNKEGLTELKAEIEDSWDCLGHILVQDLAVEGAAQKIFEAYNKLALGSLNCLINNAGFGSLGYFIDQDLQKHKSMVQVNMIALTELTYLFLPQMKQNRMGRILNMSSTAALVPGPMQAVYFASKAFISSFSNALAEELRGTGVTVTTSMPPPTESNFAKIAKLEKSLLFKKTASAQRVAQSSFKAMMKGKINALPAVSFGQKIILGTIPFSPKLIILKVVRKLHQVSPR